MTTTPIPNSQFQEEALAHLNNVSNLFNHTTECTVQHSDGSCFTNRTLSFSVTLVDSKFL